MAHWYDSSDPTNDPFADHLVGLWDFSYGAARQDTGLADGSAQDGSFEYGAYANDGALKTDGFNDRFTVSGNDTPFDMSVGTVQLQFSQDTRAGYSPDTVMSRGEAFDANSEGYFAIQVDRNGAVIVTHTDGGSSVNLTTPDNFFDPGDDVRVSYSWDENGTGSLVVENLTDGTSHEQDFNSNGLTLDIGDNDGESFTFGAREANDGIYDQHFDGEINYVAVYNTDVNSAGAGDGVVEGTDDDDYIDADYDQDPEGDMVDGEDNDAGNNDDVIIGNGGDDTILGGAGDDTIYGDAGNGSPIEAQDATPLSLSYSNYVPGSETASHSNSAEPGDSAYYSNVATLDDGTVINARLVLVSTSDPSLDVDLASGEGYEILLNGNNHSSQGGMSATIRMEFYNAETGAPVYLNSTATFNDIDSSRADGLDPEVVTVDASSFTGFGVSDDSSLSVNVSGDTVTASGTEPNSASDQDAWFSAQFEGQSSITFTLTSRDLNSGFSMNGSLIDDAVVTPFTPGNDTLIGGEGDDVIFGEAGNDILQGDSGTNTLSGGQGDDTFIGGEGADTFIGGSGQDNIDYSGSDAAVNVNLGTGELSGGDADNDTVVSGVDGVIGSEYDDVLTGFDQQGTEPGDTYTNEFWGMGGNDVISGMDGDDYISGGDGSDVISGGGGDDIIFGDAGSDVIDAGSGDDTVDGGSGDDVIMGGAGDDIISGGEGNDVISAGDGRDTVSGGAGNDTITGGGDNDTLEGGDDQDTFVITPSGDSSYGSTTVRGGSGGEIDYDTLDLSQMLANGWVIDYHVQNPDSDGNGFDGQITLYNAASNDYANINYTNIEHIIPCFTPGTRIATPRGEVAVEDLKVGDKVITRDNGLQVIRWVGRKSLSAADLQRKPELTPVRISQGALGRGLPERDMVVSPNHRMLMSDPKAALLFDTQEVLVAAKYLQRLAGVDSVPAAPVTYIHIMFDHHEVVLSDGTWSESFQPGDYTLSSIDADARSEIFALFPELRDPSKRGDFIAARRILRKHEADLLVA
nr:Hint domain-containing protein [uncultured Celeribacter sp.]